MLNQTPWDIRLPKRRGHWPTRDGANDFCLLRKENRYPQVLRSHVFLNNSRKKFVRKMSRIGEPTGGKKVMWVSFPFKACAHHARSASLWQVGGAQDSLPGRKCSRAT